MTAKPQANDFTWDRHFQPPFFKVKISRQSGSQRKKFKGEKSWWGKINSIKKWIFSMPKLLINSFVVESSWGCSQHFQQTLQVGIRCPRPVPTQVKCKSPGIRRWGIARDMTLTLQIHQKSQLLINSHQTSAAAAPNMAGRANQAYRPWGGTIYNVYVPLLFPLMLCIGSTTITTGKHQARRFVHASCLRLANKH
jgi:hypothetical protein